jgi:hypothetical protein
MSASCQDRWYQGKEIKHNLKMKRIDQRKVKGRSEDFNGAFFLQSVSFDFKTGVTDRGHPHETNRKFYPYILVEGGAKKCQHT